MKKFERDLESQREKTVHKINGEKTQMAKFLRNEDFVAHAQDYYEESTVEDMLDYIVCDFESNHLSALYDRFVLGRWSDEEGRFIDFYPLYFTGTLKELTAYFLDFLYDYGNMPEREVNKVKKSLINKVDEFLELAKAI